MEASSMNDNVSKIVNDSISGLYKIIDEAKKYMLQKEMFDRFIAAYQSEAVGLIQMITNPAITIRDVEGKIHYVVSGEKWKILMTSMYFYSLNGNEGQRVLNCTNPIDFKFDSFVVDKACCIKAMMNYEELYDLDIKTVMEINDKVMSLASLNTNGEKLDVLREVTDMIKVGITRNQEVYSVNKLGN